MVYFILVFYNAGSDDEKWVHLLKLNSNQAFKKPILDFVLRDYGMDKEEAKERGINIQPGEVEIGRRAFSRIKENVGEFPSVDTKSVRVFHVMVVPPDIYYTFYILGAPPF